MMITHFQFVSFLHLLSGVSVSSIHTCFVVNYFSISASSHRNFLIYLPNFVEKNFQKQPIFLFEPSEVIFDSIEFVI